MNASHIIFDLDGTLVNTIDDIALAMNSALTAQGFTALPLEAYPKLVGWGIRHLAERALAVQGVQTGTADGVALVNSITEAALKKYDEVPLRFSKPYPDIPELLHKLIDEGLVLAVLTNKPDSVAQQVVAGLFPHLPFALVRGDTQDQAKKPDPTLTRSVMEAMGASWQGTIFVGDSVVDVQTAHGVGCPVVGVSWGFRGPAELVTAGADHIINKPLELLELL